MGGVGWGAGVKPQGFRVEPAEYDMTTKHPGDDVKVD